MMNKQRMIDSIKAYKMHSDWFPYCLSSKAFSCPCAMISSCWMQLIDTHKPCRPQTKNTPFDKAQMLIRSLMQHGSSNTICSLQKKPKWIINAQIQRREGNNHQTWSVSESFPHFVLHKNSESKLSLMYIIRW